MGGAITDIAGACGGVPRGARNAASSSQTERVQNRFASGSACESPTSPLAAASCLAIRSVCGRNHGAWERA